VEVLFAKLTAASVGSESCYLIVWWLFSVAHSMFCLWIWFPLYGRI